MSLYIKYYLVIYLSILLLLYLWTKYFFPFKILLKQFTIPVSIMLPIFNKMMYLNRSLNSAQNQTFRDLEIICVDDCSSDQSTDLIIERMKSDFRIKLVQNFYNQGTCLSRMNGVFSSTGDYIISLDPDDSLYLNATELIYNAVVHLNADILEYRIERRHPKRNILKNWYPCSQNYTNNEEILAKLQKFKYRIVGWSTVKKIIKRTVYQKAMTFLLPYVRGKKILNAEDLLHCGTIFLYMKSFVCTQILAYIYYMKNKGSATSGESQSQIQSQVQSLYIEAVIRYFYKERENLSICSLNNLLKNKTVLNLYNNITNIDKTPKKSCDINDSGFLISNFNQSGYCMITRKSFHSPS